MDVEQLKLVTELFSKVTDGALYGGVTFLTIDLIKTVVPWGVGAVLGWKLIDKVPKVTLRKKS